MQTRYVQKYIVGPSRADSTTRNLYEVGGAVRQVFKALARQNLARVVGAFSAETCSHAAAPDGCSSCTSNTALLAGLNLCALG